MCAKFGCGPTVVSKKGGYRQTDRQRKLKLYIVDHILFLIICDAFMCVHCIVFYSSASGALINNSNNNVSSEGGLHVT